MKGDYTSRLRLVGKKVHNVDMGGTLIRAEISRQILAPTTEVIKNIKRLSVYGSSVKGVITKDSYFGFRKHKE